MTNEYSRSDAQVQIVSAARKALQGWTEQQIVQWLREDRPYLTAEQVLAYAKRGLAAVTIGKRMTEQLQSIENGADAKQSGRLVQSPFGDMKYSIAYVVGAEATVLVHIPSRDGKDKIRQVRIPLSRITKG